MNPLANLTTTPQALDTSGEMTPGRPTKLTGAWLALAEAYGGVEGLAKKCDVTTQTIWRWGNGKTNPGGPARKIVAQLAKAKHLTSPV